METRAVAEKSATEVVWESIERWREATSHTCSSEPNNCVTAYFHLGDIILQLETNEVVLIEQLLQDYSECVQDGDEVSSLPRLRCSVHKRDNGLIFLTVSEADSIDVTDLAFGLLNPDRRFHEYAVTKELIPGWWLYAVRSDPHEPFFMVRGNECILDREKLPPSFLPTYAVALAQAAQKHVLFLHAASLSIRSRGLLLVGESFSGKTTTSLTLACRGHVLLGENIAAVRIKSREVLPFRRIARVREGPRAKALDTLIEGGNCKRETVEDGTSRIRVHPSQFFPKVKPKPVILGAAFFLSGFSNRSKVERFAPEVHAFTMFRFVPVCWGATAGQRFMKLLTLREILLNVECRRLVLGSPEETAELIETTLEDLWD